MSEISQFYVLTTRGDTIIKQDYRPEIEGTPEIFFRRMKFWEGGDCPPVFNVDGINYLFLRQRGLYFVCTTRHNVSPSFTLEFLARICRIFKDYCGVLTEEAIRKNFILIYELLDECMDLGYAQGTSTENLKAHVHNEPVAVDASGGTKVPIMKANFKSSTAVRKPIAVSGDQAQKQENEIFCDILEQLNVTFSSTGQVLNSSIQGRIQMKSYLAGNPELRLALNEDLVIGRENAGAYGAVVLDDVNFHECAQLDEFERERVISFLPPDGEFTLINYRINGDYRAPFRIFPFVEELSRTQIELVIKVRADMPETNYGANVLLRIPMPQTTATVSLDQGMNAVGQLAEYRDNEKQVRWVIKKFDGGSELQLRCKINLSQPAGASVRREIGPVALTFEVPMYNVSNVQVRYLRIPEHARHAAYKYKRWVRYVTQTSSYVCRV